MYTHQICGGVQRRSCSKWKNAIASWRPTMRVSLAIWDSNPLGRRYLSQKSPISPQTSPIHPHDSETMRASLAIWNQIH